MEEVQNASAQSTSQDYNSESRQFENENAKLKEALDLEQSRYSELNERYSKLKEEFSDLSERFDEKSKVEGSTEQAEEIQVLQVELAEARGIHANLEKIINSLSEEKQEIERKEVIMKDKLNNKKAEIASLKEAVKSHVFEFEKLQVELATEKELRGEVQGRLEHLESMKEQFLEERGIQSSRVEEIASLKEILEEGMEKYKSMEEEFKIMEEKTKDYDLVKEQLKTEKHNSAR